MRRNTKIAGALAALPAIAAAAALVSPATGAGTNRAPICNPIGFNLPAPGASVTIRVLDVAADPDRTAMTLKSVFGANGGAVTINRNGTSTPDDDTLTYRRTAPLSSASEYLYWTVSDGQLSAQCLATGPGATGGGGLFGS